MKKVFIVTGANGHLGNTIVKQLLARGETVRALVMPGDNLRSLEGMDVGIYYANVCDKESMREIFLAEQRDIIVIHAAGIVSIASNNRHIEAVNVGGTRNIIELCLEYAITRLVYVSSVHAIQEAPQGQTISEADAFDPDLVFGQYAKTKAAATRLVLQSVKQGLNAVVVHPSGIIGPNDYGNGHMTQMVIDYLEGRLSACVKGGYDFVDVRDVARGVIAATQKGRIGECYILSNRFIDVETLLDIFHEVSGKRKIITVLPMWFAKLTAPLAETYYKLLRQSPLFTRYSLFTLCSNSMFDHTKATRELGYFPRDIRLTAADTVAWLIEQGRVNKFNKSKKHTAGTIKRRKFAN